MNIRKDAQLGVWEHLKSSTESVQNKLKNMTFEEFCSLEEHELSSQDQSIVLKRFPNNKEAVEVRIAHGIRVIYTDKDAMVLIDREYYHSK